MSENELREYIRTHYPKENETNEWKEFKNLKNDFNGKEKTPTTMTQMLPNLGLRINVLMYRQMV